MGLWAPLQPRLPGALPQGALQAGPYWLGVHREASHCLPQNRLVSRAHWRYYQFLAGLLYCSSLPLIRVLGPFFFFFFKDSFIYFRRGGRWRERISSIPHECGAWRRAWTHDPKFITQAEIQSQTFNQLSHPGAPRIWVLMCVCVCWGEEQVETTYHFILLLLWIRSLHIS